MERIRYRNVFRFSGMYFEKKGGTCDKLASISTALRSPINDNVGFYDTVKQVSIGRCWKLCRTPDPHTLSSSWLSTRWLGTSVSEKRLRFWVRATPTIVIRSFFHIIYCWIRTTNAHYVAMNKPILRAVTWTTSHSSSIGQDSRVAAAFYEWWGTAEVAHWSQSMHRSLSDVTDGGFIDR